MINNWKKAEDVLKKGGVVVIPTDTIYGLACNANSAKAVNRIYKIKGRDRNKHPVVLISSLSDLKKVKGLPSLISARGRQARLPAFGWNGRIEKIFKPKVSVILNSKLPAFRLVSKRNKNLYNLIKRVGPIATSSVNPQGLKPAKNIAEAKKYFGDKIDIYVSGGTKISKPSTLIEYKNNRIRVLRQGEVAIK